MYEVYALKYGERDNRACDFFYREPSHDVVTLHYFFWLILGGPHAVLVDTGCPPADAAQRELRNYVNPVEMLRRLDIEADDVPLAVITHLHWDHWAGYSLFPNAQFVLQREEVAFWTGPMARHAVFKAPANPAALGALVTLNCADRVRMIEGSREILPGLDVHWVGGHTAGLQIVTVNTARGRLVLTSDASHFYRNVERRQPVQLVTSMPDMLAGFDTIDALAGADRLVAAGHDPEVADRFKPLEPGIVRLG